MAGDRMPRHVSFIDAVARASTHDYRGPAWQACICGSAWTLLPVLFRDGQIAEYLSNGFCVECGAMFTVPTPTSEEIQHDL